MWGVFLLQFVETFWFYFFFLGKENTEYFIWSYFSAVSHQGIICQSQILYWRHQRLWSVKNMAFLVEGVIACFMCSCFLRNISPSKWKPLGVQISLVITHFFLCVCQDSEEKLSQGYIKALIKMGPLCTSVLLQTIHQLRHTQNKGWI